MEKINKKEELKNTFNDVKELKKVDYTKFLEFKSLVRGVLIGKGKRTM